MTLDKKEIWSIPNIMGYFRILLIPVYLYVYYHAEGNTGYMAAAAVVAVSGLTDMLDGKIARRFHMVTNLGKVLDPAADKLTQYAVSISLTNRFPLMVWLVALLFIKDIYLAVSGWYLLKKGMENTGATWYGKVSTAAFFVLMAILLLYTGISYFAAGILISACIALMLLSLVGYLIRYGKVAAELRRRREHEGA